MLEGFLAVWGLKMVLYMATLGVCLWRVRLWKGRYLQMRVDWDSTRAESARLRDALKVQTEAVNKYQEVAWEASQRALAANKRADSISLKAAQTARALESAEIPTDPGAAIQWLRNTAEGLKW